MINNWHTKSIDYTLDYFKAGLSGLKNQDAIKRLQDYGKNKLPEGKIDSLFLIFLRQFQSPLVYILLIASGTVLIMGEVVDALVILFVLVFNSIIGAVQEGRAQNTLLALKKFVQTPATVLRDNEEIIIPNENIVPGDIIILNEGEKIPADARIIISNGIQVNEASLTGESEPVQKIIETIEKENITINDKKNIVFKGTYVIGGNGRAIVVATGRETVIGIISQEIAVIDTEIPLKKDIKSLSKIIVLITGLIGSILFYVGVNMGNSAREMFGVVVSLAVSIVPEGLPIVITLVLANGVWRMSKRNALVKRLQAVEALGQADIIAVDKTGTITKNELIIRKIFNNGKIFNVTGDGYNPIGDILYNDRKINPQDFPDLLYMGKMATLCAEADLYFSKENKVWNIIGDPTEAAMLVTAEKMGFNKQELEKTSFLVRDIPFDYQNKFHAAVHRVNDSNILTVSGAPEVLLNLSEKIWKDGQRKELSNREREGLYGLFSALSAKGMRVLALSMAEEVSADTEADNLPALTFLGFFAMEDSIRKEVNSATEKAINAGIRVVMITGDNEITARSIARQAGIFMPTDEVVTGTFIDQVSEEELADRIGNVKIFARVTPQHKLKIVNAYRSKGKIIAMTGDGVNDAPSLVAADLGIAMGRIGTEVAKEAADIILLDDNLSSIVSAIEEGRGIYNNIKKVILYLFSTSLGETLTIVGAMLMAMPLPILPAQIIWLNLVTDGFLTVAFAMEPKSRGLLNGKFNRPGKYFVDFKMGKRMIVMAIPMFVGTLILFNNYLNTDMIKALSVSLTSLAVFQWFNAWNVHAGEKSIFKTNIFTNKFLLGATVLVIFLQLGALYNPLAQKILHTAPLNIKDWLIIITVSSSIIIFDELHKLLRRRFHWI